MDLARMDIAQLDELLLEAAETERKMPAAMRIHEMPWPMAITLSRHLSSKQHQIRSVATMQ